jgi:hypothetical protein
MSISPNPKLKNKPATVLSVPTNQLLVEFPDDWSALSQRYTLWRYRLSEHQDNHKRFADRYFYERFTNAYKNQFDQPFYFYTFDTPAAALYTLAPHGQQPEPWFYPFGTKAQPEEICGEVVAPDEVRPHILLKLLVALCFYEASPNDQERRVCQSKFYLRVKGKSGNNFLTVVEVKPTVEQENTVPYPLTLTVEANYFAKARSAEDRTNTALGAYYELFDSQGHTYFRQLRPSQVTTFEGDLYQRKMLPGKRAQADWHNDGDKANTNKYKESRSYLVHHVQERLTEFMNRYGFRVKAAEEPMERQLNRKELLPLQRFNAIQVLDNRLNKSATGIEKYLDWLVTFAFPASNGATTLPFELVESTAIDATKPLLVLNDTDKSAFGYTDDKPNLLTEHGIEDPYKSLYKALPGVIKQSLNVNPNRAEEFSQPQDYLNYSLISSSQPKPEAATAADKKAANEFKSLARNLEVCLSELWLKWVISAKADDGLPASSSLPFLAHLSDEWGFITEDLLLYFEQGSIQFADLTTPVGKKLLKERFTAWSEIKKQFMTRTHKTAEKADIALRTTHFVLIGREVMEIERTSIMAMPNWPIIKAIKAEDPTKSARTKQAIGIYAGGVWYSPQTNRYVVSGTESSAGKEARGHHIYQVHPYSTVEPKHLSTLISLLTVTFVRKNRFTVWPYPFDLIRLHQELNTSTSLSHS